MPPHPLLQLAIEIDTCASPIAGRWHAEGMPARAFTGWTELFAALDAAVSDARGSGDVDASLQPTIDQSEEV